MDGLLQSFTTSVLIKVPKNYILKKIEAEKDDVRAISDLSSDQSGNFCSHRCQHILMFMESGQAGPP